MGISLYDTLSRTVKELERGENGKCFGMYCCGPTVYGPAHIGNFRTFVVQDLLRRLLEFAGYNPLHVRNITDVDDKTIRQSQAEGISLKAFTEKWTERFHADCKALNLLDPHQEPRATAHIQQQIDLISNLIKKGFAYKGNDGSVYFRVSAFKDYGRLSHLDPSEVNVQGVGSRKETQSADEYERDAITDFALWKARKEEDGENFWKSPWGEGRPGWHIECSAMSMQYLGETMDLHAGGIDLCFPHHENEIAQAEAVTNKVFAKHWLHIVHLMVEGRKMSKSLGNLYTLKDIEEKGFSPMVSRYLLLSAHYRQPLNFTFDGLHAAQSALGRIESFVSNLLTAADWSNEKWTQLAASPQIPEEWSIFGKAWDFLVDDLNTPASLGALFTAMNNCPGTTDQGNARNILKVLAAVLFAFGLRLFTEKKIILEIPQKIRDLAEMRWQAKLSKDFALADTYRKQIAALGWEILDRKDGYDLKQ
ncbi:MAG: cysteine--tRNA ligase [Verrucomicrobia bacterium GWC2_42_7]|nr:MAG: cysteine--tRNA ligase [Verrucomicrobia bacterium GWC2_42_7]